MTEYGVRRLVAINSGNYSYAEVDLSKPVHLAAPNNRGKSTLVNALQFLYIDDFNRMKFGRRSHDDTRKHYFGEDRSYLIFECLTPTGIQCLLVRGLSNLRGGQFERYVYDGEFQNGDYLDDGNICAFETVRTNLANRHLARVKTSELWQVLAGNLPSHDGKPIPRLNILPIRRRDEYTAFRDVFVRLLSLTNADARTLRQLIIDSHAREVGERKIDVAAEYKDEFDRAERSEHALAFIGAVAAEIDAGRQLRLENQSLSDKLAAVASPTWRDANRCHRFIEAEHERLNGEATRVAGDRQDAETTRDARIDKSVDARAAVTLAERETAALMAMHAKWSVYSNEFIQGMRDNAEHKTAALAELERHLDQASRLDLDTMRRRIEQLKAQIATDRQAFERWEETGAAELRRAGVSDTEIDSAFRIANPALLKLIVGDTINIKDSDALVERIRGIAHRVSGGAYADETVEMNVARVDGPDSRFLEDPEHLRHQVALNEEELSQQAARFRAAEDQETARATLGSLRQERDALRRDLAEFDGYAKAWSERAGLEQRVAEAKQAAADIQQEISDLDKRLKAYTGEEKRLERERESLNEKKTRLAAAAREFKGEAERLELAGSLPTAGPDEDDDAARPKSLSRFVESVANKLSGLTSDLRRIDVIRGQLKDIQDSIAAKSRQIEGQERYFSDENDEWRLLIEARDSLPQLEEATTRNWDALFTTLGARLNAIVTAVSSIKTAVERINRGLKAYQVSNLRAVQIKVDEEHDTFRALEALASQGTLFQDRDAIELNKKRLRQMIERNEPIELEALFELRIHIEQMDGTTHRADSLDEIGSTGTGMTAKAMIFIQLVRAVAANEKYRLHFYIDGLGELDDRNLDATAAMAVSRGIIPITADPRLHLEPLAHPEVTVYSLGQNADGRFFIDGYKTYHARRRVEVTELAHE